MRKAALIAAALAIVAVGLFFLLDRDEERLSKGASSPGSQPGNRSLLRGSAQPSIATTNKSQGNGTLPDSISLPPLDAPVAAILADLEVRARAGDARAACRVAMEKVRCYRVLTLPTNAKKSTPEIEAQIEKDRGLCNGLEVSRTEDAWKYLSQAALGGNVAAMSLFVRDPQLSERSPIETAEGWLVYRDYAARFLTSAIEGGDTMALFWAWWTSASGLSTVGRAQEIFPKDPYRALVYGNAAAPLLDARRQAMVTRMNGMLAESMTSAQVGQAKREGEDLRRRYFADATRTSESHDDTYLAPQDCAR